MPRVFTATKNKGGSKVYKCERCSKRIEAGEKYYYYTRYRARNKSIRCMSHCPRPSELTSSETLSTAYATQEQLDDLSTNASDGQEVIDALDSAYSDIDSLCDDLQSKIDNVESAFPNGTPVLDTLQEYLENAEAYRDSIEQAKDEAESIWQSFESEYPEPDEDESESEEDGDDKLTHEDWEEKRIEAISEISGIVSSIDCPF